MLTEETEQILKTVETMEVDQGNIEEDVPKSKKSLKEFQEPSLALQEPQQKHCLEHRIALSLQKGFDSFKPQISVVAQSKEQVSTIHNS